jgi:ADP-ribose pyrophosphatase
MKERTLKTTDAFRGKLIRVEVLEVELEDGTRSVREIVRHPGAVAVVVRRRDGRFVFVRQFRKPVEDHLLEVVAGTLDHGESPERCARREVAEETRHRVDSLTPLGGLYPSPGYVAERIEAFAAEADEDPGGRHGHVADPDERVETVVLERCEVERMIRAGRIRDAKTLAAWMLYERYVQGDGRPPAGALRGEAG